MSRTERYFRKLRTIETWKPWFVVIFGITFIVTAFVSDGMQRWERVAVALSGLASAAWGSAWMRQSRPPKK